MFLGCLSFLRIDPGFLLVVSSLGDRLYLKLVLLAGGSEWFWGFERLRRSRGVI